MAVEVVEECLVVKLGRIFTHSKVMAMPEDLVTGLAGENEESRQVRQHLHDSIQTLKKGAKTCQAFSGFRLSGESLLKSTSCVKLRLISIELDTPVNRPNEESKGSMLAPVPESWSEEETELQLRPPKGGTPDPPRQRGSEMLPEWKQEPASSDPDESWGVEPSGKKKKKKGRSLMREVEQSKDGGDGAY